MIDSKEDHRSDVARQSFLEDCASRNIEVVFEEQAVELGVDSEFSQDFIRRMKEKKTQEARG